MTSASTLALFRIIGEQTARPERHELGIAKCPRCRAHLRRVRDMQRATRFEYFKCPNDHGRLTSFFEFLKEKDFIRPLTPQQIAELRKNIQMINCSNCRAPIDLAKTSECARCGSPLSMLDMQQAEQLVDAPPCGSLNGQCGSGFGTAARARTCGRGGRVSPAVEQPLGSGCANLRSRWRRIERACTFSQKSRVDTAELRSETIVVCSRRTRGWTSRTS